MFLGWEWERVIELGDMIAVSKGLFSLCQQTELCLLLRLCSQIHIGKSELTHKKDKNKFN